MKANFACPISGEQRDNTVVRLVAGIVLTIGFLAIWLAFNVSTQAAGYVLLLLASDFVIRGFLIPKWSILASTGKLVRNVLKLPIRRVDAAPKVFAARIGVLFTITSSLLFLSNSLTLSSIILVVLLVFAGLETFFDFCVGCYVYSLLPQRMSQLLSSKITLF